ncbi:proteinase inhibitor-like [Phoenix dactylifera]|uniref:Proteinase inhibitor-like n=1 Tax=Phoenix dactylifera TaxID=42345 RepID=A0A8B9ASS5_PHODC|nr:proteinase inhibitor-like [Phoenix dactylifera]
MGGYCRRSPDPSGLACPGKMAWLELMGKTANEAVRMIEDDNRYIDNVVVVHERPPGVPSDEVQCCNRVFLIVNDQNIVVEFPYVG